MRYFLGWCDSTLDEKYIFSYQEHLSPVLQRFNIFLLSHSKGFSLVLGLLIMQTAHLMSVHFKIESSDLASNYISYLYSYIRKLHWTYYRVGKIYIINIYNFQQNSNLRVLYLTTWLHTSVAIPFMYIYFSSMHNYIFFKPFNKKNIQKQNTSNKLNMKKRTEERLPDWAVLETYY